MTKRIKKIGTANGPFGTFYDGGVYAVPADLTAETAAAWVDGRYAEWLPSDVVSVAVIATAEADPIEVADAETADSPQASPARRGRKPRG